MSEGLHKQRNRDSWMGFGLDARRALRIVCYCGLAGVLPDIDHLIAWVVCHISNGATNYSSRFLHTPLLIGVGIVFCCCCAYLGRLYLKYLLEKSEGEGDEVL